MLQEALSELAHSSFFYARQEQEQERVLLCQVVNGILALFFLKKLIDGRSARSEVMPALVLRTLQALMKHDSHPLIKVALISLSGHRMLSISERVLCADSSLSWLVNALEFLANGANMAVTVRSLFNGLST